MHTQYVELTDDELALVASYRKTGITAVLTEPEQRLIDSHRAKLAEYAAVLQAQHNCGHDWQPYTRWRMSEVRCSKCKAITELVKVGHATA